MLYVCGQQLVKFTRSRPISVSFKFVWSYVLCNHCATKSFVSWHSDSEIRFFNTSIKNERTWQYREITAPTSIESYFLSYASPLSFLKMYCRSDGNPNWSYVFHSSPSNALNSSYSLFSKNLEMQSFSFSWAFGHCQKL